MSNIPTVTVGERYGDAGNQIVLVNGTATTATTYVDGGQEEIASSSGTTTLTKYFPGVEGLPQAERVGTNGTLTYLGSDGQGSVNTALNSSGAAIFQQLYTPYGSVRYSSGSSPTSYAYTGQQADATTGLDYYHARYYDPVAQQFISADSMQDGLNRYGYVGGNPETDTDPSGHMYIHGDGGGGGTPDPQKSYTIYPTTYGYCNIALCQRRPTTHHGGGGNAVTNSPSVVYTGGTVTTYSSEQIAADENQLYQHASARAVVYGAISDYAYIIAAMLTAAGVAFAIAGQWFLVGLLGGLAASFVALGVESARISSAFSTLANAALTGNAHSSDIESAYLAAGLTDFGAVGATSVGSVVSSFISLAVEWRSGVGAAAAFAASGVGLALSGLSIGLFVGLVLCAGVAAAAINDFDAEANMLPSGY